MEEGQQRGGGGPYSGAARASKRTTAAMAQRSSANWADGQNICDCDLVGRHILLFQLRQTVTRSALTRQSAHFEAASEAHGKRLMATKETLFAPDASRRTGSSGARAGGLVVGWARWWLSCSSSWLQGTQASHGQRRPRFSFHVVSKARRPTSSALRP